MTDKEFYGLFGTIVKSQAEIMKIICSFTVGKERAKEVWDYASGLEDLGVMLIREMHKNDDSDA